VWREDADERPDDDRGEHEDGEDEQEGAETPPVGAIRRRLEGVGNNTRGVRYFPLRCHLAQRSPSTPVKPDETG
jgi:hypothetical protein